MSYKHFIFDMGNVLVDFSPKYILSMYFNGVDQINYYYEKYFKSGLWAKLDNGDIDFEELIEEVQQSDAKDKEIEIDFLQTWHQHNWERKEMTKIVKKLSDKGYSIHLCSNAANSFYNYFEQYEVFEYFDSLTISATHQVSKPMAEIYQIVLEENNLRAEDCLFIDDLGANIQAAEALGIGGYLYNGNERMFEKFLKNVNVL